MAFDYTVVKPISGGGLGDCKVGIVELAGDYVTGGIDVGLKEEPIFITATGGYQAVFASGKIKLMTAGGSSSEEVTQDTDVTGVKVLFIIKGSY